MPARGVHLSREGEEALFALARVLSEGACDPSGAYFGSTMITVDLTLLARHWHGPLDAHELARTLAGSVRVRLRASRLARGEAAARVRGEVLSARTETRVTVRGLYLHLDVDLEAQIAVSSRASEGG